VSGESNSSLVARAVVYGARREGSQRRPVSAFDGKISYLSLFNGCADRRVDFSISAEILSSRFRTSVRESGFLLIAHSLLVLASRQRSIRKGYCLFDEFPRLENSSHVDCCESGRK
jgi:hypothetical protein